MAGGSRFLTAKSSEGWEQIPGSLLLGGSAFKASCKRTQHCWLTTPNIVGCYMLRPLAHPVACCWMSLRVVVQSLKPVMLFSQQLPTFLLLRDRRSVAQQCGSVCTALPTLLGPRTRITHGLQGLVCCILPTMHCRSQHCWELLHPFAHHCQHARNNSQHFFCSVIAEA